MTDPHPTESLLATVLAAFDLNAAEMVLLTEADRCQQELDRIEAALADAPLTVTGSTGQLVAHPLLMEARRHRVVLAGLIRALALPARVESAPSQTSKAVLRHLTGGVA